MNAPCVFYLSAEGCSSKKNCRFKFVDHLLFFLAKLSLAHLVSFLCFPTTGTPTSSILLRKKLANLKATRFVEETETEDEIQILERLRDSRATDEVPSRKTFQIVDSLPSSKLSAEGQSFAPRLPSWSSPSIRTPTRRLEWPRGASIWDW